LYVVVVEPSELKNPTLIGLPVAGADPALLVVLLGAAVVADVAALLPLLPHAPSRIAAASAPAKKRDRI
jgi:hypothetical protein